MEQLTLGLWTDDGRRPYDEPPTESLDDAARKLALHIYLQAVLDAKEGDADARDWLRDEGRDYLISLGCGSLAAVPVDELLSAANTSALYNALGERRRHCRDCYFLICQDGRCRCGKGMWAQQGRREDYAEATVRHDTKGLLQPCEHWRR